MIDDAKASANRRARDEKKKAHLQALYAQHAERLRALEHEDERSIVRQVHGTVDLVLERDRKTSATSTDIKCRRGCDHCCKGAVEVLPQEATLLLEIARSAGLELDKARLERQSRYGIENWREQSTADRGCVFLGDDGACKVYEHRPNSCRKLLVVTDPALCDETRYPPGSNGRWFSWEAEMVQSAALEVFGASLMPRALLAAWRSE